ncbi:guanylate kinase [Anaerovorax sp. IOR16]|uniref:guanylate kinase n=1 Tax=Anaerovorax sp. IOR16 TaxID=2773458 RepID=UPI0019CFE779|nr:guanylate kinase [Anaerovorax sp. IOR16]
MQELQSTLNETLISIGIACITLAGAYATFYLRRLTEKLKLETEKIQDDRQKELVIEALYRLDDVASKTVSAIEQTAADIIRKDISISDGDRKEKLQELGIRAYDQIIKTLEPEYVKALNESLGDFEGYVKSTIEDKVRLMKEEKHKA